ncbi:MAG TPA: FixH family protein, partial [Pirellulales bacterium]
AGGPSREYQFLRNQLYRDKTSEVDVFLQIYQPGMSQDARNILTEFPSTAAELSEYDAIVAFDPDWKALTPAQVDLLEAWVAEQSGGLIAAAGPVYTEKWTQAPELQKIRALYPVEFNRRFSLLDSGRFDNREARPLEITRAGSDAQFLWIEDSPEMSQRAWSDFDGVYGYYSVRGAKDGATVYARFADPDAEADAAPIYFAGQIYGSGRVFYMGSSEMWRLRAADEAYFERFWTKLIRYVSQERMRRGAKRGVLLVERDTYDLGQPVQVAAQVRTTDQKPLDAASVDLDVLNPNGSPMRVQLKPSKSGGPGTFAGQFTPREPGSYRIEVVIPDATEEDRLTHQIEVTLPDLEQRNNVRNDAVLSRLAAETGGTYLVGADKAGQVVDLLPAKTRTELQLERPISQWDRPWVLAAVVSLLCLEWLLRRLLKLA